MNLQPTLHKVLIDSSILHHANIGKGTWSPTAEVNHSSFLSENDGGHIGTKIVETQSKKYCANKEVGAIVALGSLMRTGLVEAYTTDALKIERLSDQNGNFRPTTYGAANLLSNVTLVEVKTLPPYTVSSLSPPNDQLASLRGFLKQKKSEQHATQPYTDIANSLGDSDTQDAWHLHSCERYKIDYFLTMDLRLCNKIRSLPRSDLKTQLEKRIKRPTELCRELNTEPLDPERVREIVQELSGFPIITDPRKT